MSIPTPFVKSWQQMIEYNSEYFVKPTERIFYTHATVSYHSFARNSLADQMMGDWILMLDADITFDPDILIHMLYKMNKFDIDVLVAPYLYKSPPHPPVLYGYNPKTKAKTIMGDWKRKNVDLIPIRGSGAGCLLVRRKVFNKIQLKMKQSPFDIYVDKQGSPLSEDHSFFERLWKLKIPAYACPDIFVNHLIYKELKVDKDYNPKNQLLRKEVIDPFWSKKWSKIK
jgi:glycosyltransferase involved in cell wall biosynthesis